MRLTISSCPNDTFIFYALAHRKIDLNGLSFELEIADIEQLNNFALNQYSDISKVSAALIPFINNNYSVLESGGAFSPEGGPLLISRPGVMLNDHSVIAIPGKYTTANALFDMYYQRKCRKEYVLFSEILDMLSSGKADAGVIIHEDRFTYSSQNFVSISDLGLMWCNEFKLPVPLGVIVMKNEFDLQQRILLGSMIRKSISYAQENHDEVFEWVQQHAVNIDPEIIRKHISFYVNDYSMDFGKAGEASLVLLNKQIIQYEHGHSHRSH
jgi:1,4-dihydroxy-6-naphthoate synthase